MIAERVFARTQIRLKQTLNSLRMWSLCPPLYNSSLPPRTSSFAFNAATFLVSVPPPEFSWLRARYFQPADWPTYSNINFRYYHCYRDDYERTGRDDKAGRSTAAFLFDRKCRRDYSFARNKWIKKELTGIYWKILIFESKIYTVKRLGFRPLFCIFDVPI